VIRLAVNIGRGGSGKTTVAVNLAAALALRGKRTLLLDLDPQADTTAWLLPDLPSRPWTVAEVLAGTVSTNNAIVESRDNLFMLPGTPALVALDRSNRPLADLKQALGPLQGFDAVLADTPPSQYSWLALAAMQALGDVLIPVRFDAMSYERVDQAAGVADQVGAAVRWIVCNDTNPQRTLTADVAKRLGKSYGSRVAKTHIRQNAALATAYAWHETIFEHDPRSNGAVDFQSLASEVLRAEKRATK